MSEVITDAKGKVVGVCFGFDEVDEFEEFLLEMYADKDTVEL